ncbi:MAG: hypothetical protein R3E66_22590 [bacterium]
MDAEYREEVLAGLGCTELCENHSNCVRKFSNFSWDTFADLSAKQFEQLGATQSDGSNGLMQLRLLIWPQFVFEMRFDTTGRMAEVNGFAAVFGAPKIQAPSLFRRGEWCHSQIAGQSESFVVTDGWDDYRVHVYVFASGETFEGHETWGLLQQWRQV